MFDYIAVGVAHSYVGRSGGMLPQKCFSSESQSGACNWDTKRRFSPKQ